MLVLGDIYLKLKKETWVSDCQITIEREREREKECL